MSNLSFSTETITPVVAEQYLSKNTRNRNKKKLAIQRYARDMIAGRWQETGEAIKFDTNGDLCDGQNRLFAVIESGATVDMAVIRGVAPEAMKVMDIVAPRSGADSLKMAGYYNTNALQAAANAHYAYNTGLLRHCMYTVDSTMRMTNAEVVDYVDAHPQIPQLVAVANTFRRPLPLPAGAIATAYDTLVRIDADQAADFFNRIQDMISTGKGDPVGTLIQRAMRERAGRNRVEVSTGLFYIFRAWNAFRDGVPFHTYQLGSRPGWAAIPVPK